MTDLALSKASDLGTAVKVDVWQIPKELVFPPGINLIYLVESGEYFLLNKTKLQVGDWIVVALGQPTKMDNATFLTKYSVDAVVSPELQLKS